MGHCGIGGRPATSAKVGNKSTNSMGTLTLIPPSVIPGITMKSGERVAISKLVNLHLIIR